MRGRVLMLGLAVTADVALSRLRSFGTQVKSFVHGALERQSDQLKESNQRQVSSRPLASFAFDSSCSIVAPVERLPH